MQASAQVASPGFLVSRIVIYRKSVEISAAESGPVYADCEQRKDSHIDTCKCNVIFVAQRSGEHSFLALPVRASSVALLRPGGAWLV
ncbi:hypothetical protein D3C79_890130 [compost metagenome]